MKLLHFFQSLLSSKQVVASNANTSVPPTLQLMTGKLKFFNKKVGYGLIETKTIKGRIFVHISDVQEHLKAGSMVEFQLMTNEKGYQAKKVKKH